MVEIGICILYIGRTFGPPPQPSFPPPPILEGCFHSYFFTFNLWLSSHSFSLRVCDLWLVAKTPWKAEETCYWKMVEQLVTGRGRRCSDLVSMSMIRYDFLYVYWILCRERGVRGRVKITSAHAHIHISKESNSWIMYLSCTIIL